MAPRSSWKGHLKLSLVSCPVRLYNATSSADKISFNLLHKDTKNRVQMKPVDPDLGLVERSDLIKGYQYEKNQYVIMEDEDFEKVKIESSDAIDIEAFVDRDSVDQMYMDSPYYLAPDGKMAEETFAVIRDAMAKAGKIGLARLVLSSRERMVAIDVRDKGMLVTTLRNNKEVRSQTAYFEDIPDSEADPDMLELAAKLVEQKEGEFDPKEFTDRYEETLVEVIRAKVAGEEPVVSAAPDRGNVVNLMDALKKSLEEDKPPAKSKSRKTAVKADDKGAKEKSA